MALANKRMSLRREYAEASHFTVVAVVVWFQATKLQRKLYYSLEVRMLQYFSRYLFLLVPTC